MPGLINRKAQPEHFSSAFFYESGRCRAFAAAPRRAPDGRRVPMSAYLVATFFAISILAAPPLAPGPACGADRPKARSLPCFVVPRAEIDYDGKSA